MWHGAMDDHRLSDYPQGRRSTKPETKVGSRRSAPLRVPLYVRLRCASPLIQDCAHLLDTGVRRLVQVQRRYIDRGRFAVLLLRRVRGALSVATALAAQAAHWAERPRAACHQHETLRDAAFHLLALYLVGRLCERRCSAGERRGGGNHHIDDAACPCIPGHRPSREEDALVERPRAHPPACPRRGPDDARIPMAFPGADARLAHDVLHARAQDGIGGQCPR
mmetsp:Transcript_8814/g.25615  ORF Transcript_8814/g.25615 Transcript_8814/m.25615 type:complete len:222 (+) Transcript_8814:551-1216(+)